MNLNKKIYIAAAFFGLVLIIIFPIIVNFLMGFNFKVQGGEEEWISFFASFYGAILGGIISGVLTLGGVYLTIRNEQRNRTLDTFPIKRKHAGTVINELDKFKSYFGEYYYEDPDDEQNDFKIPDIKLDGFYDYVRSSQHLLSSASMVNANFFKIIRNIIFYLEEIERLHKATPFHPYHYLDIMNSRAEYASRIFHAIESANEEAKRIDKELDKILE